MTVEIELSWFIFHFNDQPHFESFENIYVKAINCVSTDLQFHDIRRTNHTQYSDGVWLLAKKRDNIECSLQFEIHIPVIDSSKRGKKDVKTGYE